MSSRRKPLSRGEKELGQKAIVLLFLVYIVWVYAIQPIIEWVNQNITTIITIFIGLMVLAMVICILYWKYKTKKEAEERAYEEGQKAKGFVKFVDRFGSKRWGKPNEVEKWEKEDEEAREKEKLINQIIGEIENFKQSRNHRNEFPYQLELMGCLKSKFPNADIEQQKGSSRPDIVVGDIAIEVKGPTRTTDLGTIADECMRYCQHFEELIIVLFEVDVYERRYREWERGMKNTFPNVKIIKK